MSALYSRAQQWLVSIIGTLLFVPLYIFWGGVFVSSFSAYDSIYGWGFGLVACWSQIMAMLASFMTPRRAAFWMLSNVAIGMLLDVGHIAESAHAHTANHFELWLHQGRVFSKAFTIFWGPPMLFAWLLLTRAPVESKDMVLSRTSE